MTKRASESALPLAGCSDKDGDDNYDAALALCADVVRAASGGSACSGGGAAGAVGARVTLVRRASDDDDDDDDDDDARSSDVAPAMPPFNRIDDYVTTAIVARIPFATASRVCKRFLRACLADERRRIVVRTRLMNWRTGFNDVGHTFRLFDIAGMFRARNALRHENERARRARASEAFATIRARFVASSSTRPAGAISDVVVLVPHVFYGDGTVRRPRPGPQRDGAMRSFVLKRSFCVLPPLASSSLQRHLLWWASLYLRVRSVRAATLYWHHFSSTHVARNCRLWQGVLADFDGSDDDDACSDETYAHIETLALMLTIGERQAWRHHHGNNTGGGGGAAGAGPSACDADYDMRALLLAVHRRFPGLRAFKISVCSRFTDRSAAPFARHVVPVRVDDVARLWPSMHTFAVYVRGWRTESAIVLAPPPPPPPTTTSPLVPPHALRRVLFACSDSRPSTLFVQSWRAHETAPVEARGCDNGGSDKAICVAAVVYHLNSTSADDGVEDHSANAHALDDRVFALRALPRDWLDHLEATFEHQPSSIVDPGPHMDAFSQLPTPLAMPHATVMTARY